MTKATFEGFAVVEIMGHRKAAGYVTEVEVFGKRMVKIDVPTNDNVPPSSVLLSPDAVFSMAAVPEEVVKAALCRSEYRYEPVPPYLLRHTATPALPAYADDAGDVIDSDYEPVPFETSLAASLIGSAHDDEPDAGDSGIVELFGAPSSAAEAATVNF